jgi:DNA transformation protein
MPVSAAYKAFVKDLLSDFGPISIRNMFSGAGIYVDGVIFAIIFDDTLYLKADEIFSRAFAAEGKGPFTYRRKGVHRSPCPIGKCLSACSTTLKSS